jgi:hypothetical protein
MPNRTTRCPSRRRPLAVLAVALAPLLAACPLPIAHTEATSAPVVGRLVRDDGRPIAGADVAITTQWGDGACAKPALRTTTDSAGAFHLAGTEKTYKVAWIVPNLDRLPPSFLLCTGVGDTLRAAYVGSGSLRAPAEPDSVSCVAWELEGRPRVTCSGRVGAAVVTGGQWTEPSDGRTASGFYRLFFTAERTRVKGYEIPMPRPFVYVQWVEDRRAARAAGEAPYRVRATTLLPMDRNKVWALSGGEIWRREGKWVASLHGAKHAFMNDFASAELIFELGPPGQATKVGGP